MPNKLAYRDDWAVCREKLAWAAGFIDGEGCFTVYRHRSSLRARFTVNQVGNACLLRLRAALPFGANVNGPYDLTRHNPNAQPQFSYTLSGFHDIQALLALVWIWLGPSKRKSAIKVLSVCKKQTRSPQRRSFKMSVS